MFKPFNSIETFEDISSICCTSNMILAAGKKGNLFNYNCDNGTCLWGYGLGKKSISSLKMNNEIIAGIVDG